MAYSPIEQNYLNMLADSVLPPPEAAQPSVDGMQLAAGPSDTRTDAPRSYGSIRAVEPTTFEKALQAAGIGLEQAGRFLDGLGQVDVPVLGPVSLADFVPFVGSAKPDTRSVMGEPDWQGTPKVLQAPAAGQPIVTGKGQAMQLSPDAKLAAMDVAINAKPVASALKKTSKALAPTAANMMESGLRKTGMIMDVVPVENYMFVAADAAARVDNGAVQITNKVSKGKKLQLDPQYRVTVKGAYEPQGGGQNIPNDVNPGNLQDASFRLDNLSEAFPDPLESPEKFSTMMATVYNSTEVPMPPKWMIENANNMDKWSGWFSTMSKSQIDEADRGFAVVDKFKNIYSNGTAKADTTGRLMMWAMLSRMASAYPHESGFLDLAQAMGPIINKAVSGVYSAADIDEGLRIVQQVIPAGSPGRSVISNANDFVKVFLPKMAETLPDGRSRLQALHDMIIDKNMTGPQIRREFYGLAENVGIKNKVLSFALLVSGREDVMVLDRIQINRLFAGGDKIYDDVAKIFDGGPGLAIYEGLERSLAPRVKELYDRVGRGDKASIGRYHWESWVLSSGQEVAHPTLDTIVKSAKGEADAFVGVPVMEGRTHQTVYGVTYERTPGGNNRFVYTASDGEKYQFNKNELDAMFTSVMKGKDKAVPNDFPGVKYFSKDTLPDGSPNPYFGKPWYTWPGVNRERIDEAATTYGTRINATGRSRDLEGAVQGSLTNGSQRANSVAGTEASITRGSRAPAKGAQ